LNPASLKNTYGKLIKRYRALPVSAKASFWFLLANIFQKGVIIICTPIFTRLLTTEEYGKYPTFQSFQTVFMVVTTLRIFDDATAKALVKYKKDREGFVSSAQGLITLLTLTSFIIITIFYRFIGTLIDLPYWIIALLFFDILTTSAFNLWSYKERYELRYRLLVARSIFMGVISPGIALALIYLNSKIGISNDWVRVLGWVIGNGIVGAWLYVNNLRSGRKLFNKEYWVFCLKFCLPLIPYFLSSAFLTKSGQIAVDRFSGADKAGIFGLANSLSTLMLIFNDALTKTLIPWTYTKISENNTERIKNPVNIMAASIALLNLLLMLAAPEVVMIFAGTAYKEAVYIIPPLACTSFFMFLFSIFANVEFYFEETKLVSAASVTAGILAVALNFALVPKFGYLAAGYISMFCYAFYATMHLIFMKITLKKHLNGHEIYDCRFLSSLSICLVIAAIGIVLLYKTAIIRYLIIVALFGFAAVKRKILVEQIRKVKRRD
jgi:O-antigen/teichoic acid export membrane protein